MASNNGFATIDQRWMRRALAVAKQALFVSDPNPRVGCVLVKNGRWLAEGYTQKAGGNHAEVQAINSAHAQGLDITGATAYVTLEPCNHTGRTKPCVDALIAAQVGRVVIALQDPNPKVAGQGIARLRQAGIQVSAGLFAAEALALNPGFCARMTRKTPWLWLKSAASLDGFTALPDGASQWITGQQARADGHYWRAKASMVLTGIGTIQADNPSLNVRYIDTPRQPLRAVLDSKFTITPQARVFDGNPVYIFTCNYNAAKVQALAAKNVQVIKLPATAAGHVDLHAFMQWCGRNEINEVHVEAGARLQGSLLAAGLVDQWLTYIAPCVLGAGLGLASLPQPLSGLDEAYRFEFLSSMQLGADIRLLLQNNKHWQQLKSACSV